MPKKKREAVVSGADGAERGQKPKAHAVGLGFVRDGVKPRVANRRSVTAEKRGAVVSGADGGKEGPG